MKQNQQGAIVIFVVVMIGIVSILYASIYLLIGIENNIYQSLEYRTKAYYVAESGLERGVALVKQNITTPFASQNPFAPQYIDEHGFDVVVEQVQPQIYKITSTGTYANTKRIVEATVLKSANSFAIQSWKEVN